MPTTFLRNLLPLLCSVIMAGCGQSTSAETLLDYQSEFGERWDTLVAALERYRGEALSSYGVGNPQSTEGIEPKSSEVAKAARAVANHLDLPIYLLEELGRLDDSTVHDWVATLERERERRRDRIESELRRIDSLLSGDALLFTPFTALGQRAVGRTRDGAIYFKEAAGSQDAFVIRALLEFDFDQWAERVGQLRSLAPSSSPNP